MLFRLQSKLLPSVEYFPSGLTSQRRLSNLPGISFQLRQKKKLGNPSQKPYVEIAKNFMMMTSIT